MVSEFAMAILIASFILLFVMITNSPQWKNGFINYIFVSSGADANVGDEATIIVHGAENENKLVFYNFY